MNIKFKTNLDWYNKVEWPKTTILPPINSNIFVSHTWYDYCKKNNIPPYLKVTSIRLKDYKDEWNKTISYYEVELEYAEWIIKHSNEDRIKHLMQQ